MLDKILNNFSWTYIGDVKEFNIKYNNELGDQAVNLHISAEYYNSKWDVEIEFHNVKQLKIPVVIGPNLIEMSELQIIDIKNSGLENINYEVTDYGSSSGISFLCKEIQLKKVLNTQDVKWEGEKKIYK